jgi:sialic acid synthase SpsE
VVETPENDLNMNKVIIIAEAGVNHSNCDIQVAKKLIGSGCRRRG